jgi:hypothetical protein
MPNYAHNQVKLHSRVLTLNQPGSGKDVKFRGPFCFDLAFTRCKLTSPGICVVCHRALRFRKSTQNGAAPAMRERERARLRTRHPPHSTRPAAETDWNVDWRIHSKTKRKGRSWQYVFAARLLTKKRQNGC